MTVAFAKRRGTAVLFRKNDRRILLGVSANWNKTNMTSTRTIDVLLDIMGNTDIGTRLRIDAAEQLLGFEAPDDVVIRARDFLMEVFDNKEETLTDRM